MLSEKEFLTDRDIAGILSVSPDTIRVQRHYRRKGIKHYLTIDPVMVGSLPRYRREDVEEYVDRLKAKI